MAPGRKDGRLLYSNLKPNASRPNAQIEEVSDGGLRQSLEEDLEEQNLLQKNYARVGLRKTIEGKFSTQGLQRRRNDGDARFHEQLEEESKGGFEQLKKHFESLFAEMYQHFE